jgi:hypothetical protein
MTFFTIDETSALELVAMLAVAKGRLMCLGVMFGGIDFLCFQKTRPLQHGAAVTDFKYQGRKKTAIILLLRVFVTQQTSPVRWLLHCFMCRFGVPARGVPPHSGRYIRECAGSFA